VKRGVIAAIDHDVHSGIHHGRLFGSLSVCLSVKETRSTEVSVVDDREADRRHTPSPSLPPGVIIT
jgi:hypothetical protein